MVGWIKMKLGTEVYVSAPNTLCSMETRLLRPPPKGGHSLPPIFGPCPLWPNGWMDQDATWNEVGLGPKGGHSPTFLGQYLLWPNGWMDHDTTWYGGRPRPRPHFIRWGLSSPLKKWHSPLFRPMSVVASAQATLCTTSPIIFVAILPTFQDF